MEKLEWWQGYQNVKKFDMFTPFTCFDTIHERVDTA